MGKKNPYDDAIKEADDLQRKAVKAEKAGDTAAAKKLFEAAENTLDNR